MERERSATIPQQLAPSTSDEQVRAHFERAPACLRRIAEEERQLQRDATRRAPSGRPRQYDWCAKRTAEPERHRDPERREPLMKRQPLLLPRWKPWQLLPSSLPRRYFQSLTYALTAFAVLAWIVLHQETNAVARGAWIALQFALLLACPAAALLGIRALLAPALASPRYGPLLRAIAVAALVIAFASVILAEAVRKASPALLP